MSFELASQDLFEELPIEPVVLETIGLALEDCGICRRHLLGTPASRVTAMEDVIEFYLVDDPYGWMSNFAPYPITIDGARGDWMHDRGV